MTRGNPSREGLNWNDRFENCFRVFYSPNYDYARVTKYLRYNVIKRIVIGVFKMHCALSAPLQYNLSCRIHSLECPFEILRDAGRQTKVDRFKTMRG